MSAQPAYSYSAPKSTPSLPLTPHIHATPGRKPQEAASVNPSSVVAIIVTVLLVFMAIGCARVFLTSQAVVTSKETTQWETKIQNARSVGAELEVSRSSLSNPESINRQAVDLGMVAPDEIGTIVMEQDVVVLDESGALSLSESLVSAVELEAQP